MGSEQALKQEMVLVCRMLHQKNLIAGMDGNVSVKYGEHLLTTPSGVNKGFLRLDQIITVDMEGKVVQGQGQPTSELALHLEVYRQRPEVNAVLHAHPPLTTAFSLAGISLEEFILPEVVMTLGVIPTASYATPTTTAVPESIQGLIERHDALILERHGALTVGRDLLEAYNKMEKLEHAALIIYSALSLGRVNLLPPREVEKLIQLRLLKKLQSL